MTNDRKVVSFDDQPDATKLAAYQKLVDKAKNRGQAVPLGGAPEVSGIPNMLEAQERSRNPGMPGLDRPYREDEFREAVARGAAVKGVGAAYPANQRKSLGEHAAMPRDDRLRPETREGLAALAQANQSEPEPDKKHPSESQEPAGPKPSGKPADVDPDFIKMLLGQQTDPMQRKERRKKIEARLEPLNIRHLLVGTGVIQTVPIIPDVFVVKYRSISGHEDTFAKRYAWGLAKGDNSQMYYDTVMSLVNLTLSLREVNDEEVIDHRLENGVVDEAVFTDKFESLMSKPFVMLHDLWVNFMWFDQRVRDLLDVESLGNG